MTPGVYGASVGDIYFVFRVPDDGWWSVWNERTLYVRDDPTAGWLRFWNPDEVYADPCQHGSIVPGGASAAGLAIAMAKIPGTRVTVSWDTRIDRYPAKYLEMTVSNDGGCIPHDTYLWRDSNAVDQDAIRRPRLADSLISVWVVDIKGRRLVIDTDVAYSPVRRANEVVHELVESVRFVSLTSGMLRYVGDVSRICVIARDRLANDRAVVGGVRDHAPEFATLKAASAHAAAAADILEDTLHDLRDLSAPPEVEISGTDAFGLITSTINHLREAVTAAGAGDAAGARAFFGRAYQATNRPVSLSSSISLSLLDTGMSGCRLPSSSG